MPGVISESYTAPNLDPPTYNQIVAFGRVLAGHGFDVDRLLEYFEKPWKWEREFQIWRHCGELNADDICTQVK